MKKISIAILLVSIALTSFAQNVDLRRKIEVVGVVEREVTPDIINVTISLKEYMDGKNKVTISQLESALEKAVQEAGIPKGDFTVNNLSSYQQVVSKKKDPNFLASKQYGIRFRDLNRFNQILSKLDAKGVQSTYIDSYDYSKMAEVKQELKIAALIAARDKAAALVGALNEKLGSVINIVENDDNMGNYPAPRAMMYANKVLAADAAAPESDIDARKIKLSFRVNATFEIGK
ncbi:SIMPL domain-containing protein [Mucilaginibacter myungsuensis]|uniref:SIMPL domain-containing protein n=1 Tax=Mucilaginibacter myungsuensis TaxID=649104 RepID=A0A929KV86_9SPHI|nr:SIMPL domain-containing protein [Mucilaginibacter myungsuensis]MBE9661075.1 SIMPL domain-containing protein [Mucilaginibacter myungsuensis]MDN3597219.1 SIMPL domain-containing protein [Mucilaginibacter myungsuensis]